MAENHQRIEFTGPNSVSGEQWDYKVIVSRVHCAGASLQGRFKTAKQITQRLESDPFVRVHLGRNFPDQLSAAADAGYLDIKIVNEREYYSVSPKGEELLNHKNTLAPQCFVPSRGIVGHKYRNGEEIHRLGGEQ